MVRFGGFDRLGFSAVTSATGSSSSIDSDAMVPRSIAVCRVASRASESTAAVADGLAVVAFLELGADALAAHAERPQTLAPRP